MVEANTLAYDDVATITAAVSFIVQVPEAVFLFVYERAVSDIDRSMHISLWV